MIKQEVIKTIQDHYRIVKLPKDKGMFAFKDINGRIQQIEDKSYTDLYAPQILIDKKWYWMAEGVNPITKKANNPKAFKTPKLCEEFIKDYHSRQLRIMKELKKNE